MEDCAKLAAGMPERAALKIGGNGMSAAGGGGKLRAGCGPRIRNGPAGGRGPGRHEP